MKGVPSASRLSLLALLGVFAVALATRAHGLGDRSFWLDEDTTLATALAPSLGALWERLWTADLGKGPVYYLLLRAWCGSFGASEASVRLPSALAGALAAAAAGLWALGLVRVFRPDAHRAGAAAREAAVGALAGLAYALHPVSIGLCREARSYSLSHMLMLLAAAGTVPAYLAGPETTRRSRRAWRLSVPILAALGVSTHLSSIFFAAGLLAGVLLAARRLGRPPHPVLAGGLAAGLLLLTQVPLSLAQVSVQYGGAGRIALSLRDAGHYAKQLLGGAPAAFAVVPLLAVVAWRRRRHGALRAALAVLLAAGLGVLAVQVLVPGALLAGGARYLAWVAGPLAVVLGLAALDRPPAACAGAVMVVSAMLVAAHSGRELERRYSEDWRAVARTLENEIRHGDVVVCHAEYVARPLLRYSAGPVPLVAGSGRDLAAALARASAQRGPAGRILLVLSHAGPLDDAVRRAEAVLGPGDVLHSQFAVRVLRFAAPDPPAPGAR